MAHLEQAHIDLFADATDDHQRIHVDPERAAEGPFGTTIAHGYLSLSLVPAMLDELLEVSDRGRGLSYGAMRLNFTAPVPVGSRIRLRGRIAWAAAQGEGVRFHVAAEVEVEGSERPALVAELAYLAYP